MGNNSNGKTPTPVGDEITTQIESETLSYQSLAGKIAKAKAAAGIPELVTRQNQHRANLKGLVGDLAEATKTLTTTIALPDGSVMDVQCKSAYDRTTYKSKNVKTALLSLSEAATELESHEPYAPEPGTPTTIDELIEASTGGTLVELLTSLSDNPKAMILITNLINVVGNLDRAVKDQDQAIALGVAAMRHVGKEAAKGKKESHTAQSVAISKPKAAPLPEVIAEASGAAAK